MTADSPVRYGYEADGGEMHIVANVLGVPLAVCGVVLDAFVPEGDDLFAWLGFLCWRCKWP